MLTGVSALSLAGLPAKAQGSENADQLQFEEIVVTGVRGSILNSLDQKRNARGFADAISSEDLGKFPDLNLSESLQRIPGVTLTRNDFGDGASINLRGLGPAFSRVEINGLTAPVNDARGGGFNFEILASELFSNATVKKSFEASDVEGGLAGIVEISTPKALDRDGFNLAVSAQGQYAEYADDLGPRAAILISHNWNDVFGISASLAYSDTRYHTSSNGGISARPLSAPATDDLRATASADQLAGLVPQTINFEINEDARKTIGGTFGIQFRPNEALDFKLDAIVADIESESRFTRADAPPESQISAIENETITNGAITSATLTDVQNRIAVNDNDGREDFFQLSASLEFTPNEKWTITPFIGFAERELSNDASLLSMARGDLSTGQLLRFPVTYDVNGSFIEFSSPGLDLSDGDLAQEYFLNVFLIRPTVDKDEELSSKLDFRRDFEDSALSHIDFGGRFSNRKLSRQFIEVRVDNLDGDTDLRTLPTLHDALEFAEFDINGMPTSFPNQIITGDADQLLDLYFLDGFDIDAFRSPVEGPVTNQRIEGLTVPGSVLINRQARAAQNTFAGEEETIALYSEATFEFDALVFNAGLRYVNSKQISSGYEVANDVSSAIDISNRYSALLPSMSLRYEAEENLILRAAYSKSLTRPTLFDLRASESFGGIDESGGTGSRGNPELDPFTSDNIDLGGEWYFADESLIALNVFYKKIDGLIVSGSSVEDREYLSQVTGELVTGPITFTSPVNGGEAEIKGLEFIAQTRFDFLPGPLSNFGGIFNYTFADSDAAFEEGDETSEVASIPGLSKHSFNAILYYDDGSLDARLSYAYRDRFVETTAGSFGVPVFQNARGQLDFSANYALTDQFTLQFQVLNITKERLETQSLLNLPHDTGQLDRRMFFGMRYNF